MFLKVRGFNKEGWPSLLPSQEGTQDIKSQARARSTKMRSLLTTGVDRHQAKCLKVSFLVTAEHTVP